MRKSPLLIAAAILAAGFATTAPEPAEAAKGNCFNKAAEGTNTD